MRFFKCNVLGGFRLSDLNKNIKQGEYFFIENQFCETSRAVKAALQAKWMVEVTEKEASYYLSIPKNTNELKTKQVNFNQIATPSVAETNQKLESRQAERNFRKQVAQKQKTEEKPITPNFNEAEQKMKLRQADITTKGPDEVLQSPVEIKKEAEQQETVKDLAKEIADNEMLITPDFNEKKEEVKAEITQQIETKVRRRRRHTTEETTATGQVE